MNHTPVINELTYRGYCWQRSNFPEVHYRRWAALFGGEAAVDAMEDMYCEQFIRCLLQAACDENDLPN